MSARSECGLPLWRGVGVCRIFANADGYRAEVLFPSILTGRRQPAGTRWGSKGGRWYSGALVRKRGTADSHVRMSLWRRMGWGGYSVPWLIRALSRRLSGSHLYPVPVRIEEADTPVLFPVSGLDAQRTERPPRRCGIEITHCYGKAVQPVNGTT